MNVKDQVVERFKELCVQQGIATNEMAKQAGVTPSTVYSLYNEERRNVNIDVIYKLCKGFGITLGNFFDSEIFE